VSDGATHLRFMLRNIMIALVNSVFLKEQVA